MVEGNKSLGEMTGMGGVSPEQYEDLSTYQLCLALSVLPVRVQDFSSEHAKHCIKGHGH